MDARTRKIQKAGLYSKQKTLEWISKKKKELGDRATWLIGNHDLTYLTCYVENFALNRATQHFANWNCICSGFTRKGARKFSRYVDEEWLFGLELAVKVGKFTVSHAGFHPKQFAPGVNIKRAIKESVLEWRGDRSGGYLRHELPWIARCGKVRKGQSEVGSPIWLDFWEEFEPIEGINQVVGHTGCPHFYVQHNHTEHSKNFCIDHSQQGCAVINGGKLIKHIQIYH